MGKEAVEHQSSPFTFPLELFRIDDVGGVLALKSGKGVDDKGFGSGYPPPVAGQAV